MIENSCIPKSVREKMSHAKVGAKNPMWRGDVVGYTAAHRRVEAVRGKPKICQHCHWERFNKTDKKRFEWASLSGDFLDVNDYIRLCVSCHRRFDKLRNNNGGK